MAARIAAPFRGTTGASPTVGALVVDSATQALLGRAVTPPGGREDASVLALQEAGKAARGATLCATLAPTGEAPLEAIITAGLSRLICGVAEPDGRLSATAGERLRGAGIALETADNVVCRRLHEGHVSRVVRGRPFVTARLAVSADGMAARPGRSNSDLMGEAAGRWNAMQRALADAVLVGWGTAVADDPLLTVDLPGLQRRSPLRVVVAGQKAHAPRGVLLTAPSGGPVAVIAIPEKKLSLPVGVEMIAVRGSGGRRPDLGAALAALAARGVQDVYVETGPTLLEALLATSLIDRFHLIRTEAVIGPTGSPATPRGSLDARLALAGFSLVDHRLLGVDNLRTFERS